MKYATALVAGFAAASSAFLIPPSFPNDIIKDTRFEKDHKNNKDLVHALLAEKTEVVDLECPGCPYAIALKEDRDAGPTIEGIAWEMGVENSIHLEFDTHDHSVQVNGHPIFPFEAAQKARSTLVKASQIRKDTHERSVNFPLNFAADVGAPIRSPDNDNIELIGIEFTILGLNGIPVKVPSISIHLIKTPLDEYVITKINTIPFVKTPGAKTCDSATSWSLCRIKAILDAHVHRVLEAARHKSHMVQDWIQHKPKGCNKGAHPPPPPPHHKPHHGDEDRHHPGPHHGNHHMHGHHRHHGRYHRYAHMLHQVFRFFIIPATLGIIGGLAASAIGVIFGQAIVFLWIRMYRNGQRGPLRVREEIVIIDEEKDELLGEIEEPLPEYKDVVTTAEVIETVPIQDEKNDA